MKCRCYEPLGREDVIDEVLLHRDIPEDELQDWKDADCKGYLDIQDWGDLDHIKDAVLVLSDHVDCGDKAVLLVDCDPDGWSASSLLYNFLYSLYPQWIEDNLTLIQHSGKQHGLKDCLDDILKINPRLVLIPDAGSSDFEEFSILDKHSVDVLVLDHHPTPDDATTLFNTITIVNNQLSSKYRNKQLSGVGVTAQFCRAYNSIVETAGKIDWDLCAWGNLSDMMAYNSLETRNVISYGLRNIQNAFLEAMIEKNRYSIDKRGGINYMSMAFYVTPQVNSIVRVGSQEEKEFVFSALLDSNRDVLVPSGKRGDGGKMVPLADEAVRIAGNVKNRQTQIQDALLEQTQEQIEEQSDQSVLVVKLEKGTTVPGMAGVFANKLQSTYQKPSFVLIDDGEEASGSARNYSKSSIEDLREFCENSGYFQLAQGHASAFGAKMKDEDIDAFIDYANTNIPADEFTYWVDFAWRLNDAKPQRIYRIANSKSYWGQQVDEPLVAVADIPIGSLNIELLSPDRNPTLKMSVKNSSLSFIKFKSSQEEVENVKSAETVTIVGKCEKNEYNGEVKPQIIVEDYELSDDMLF